MSTPADDDRVGYKRPPRRTRWKKGQSGNPRKQKTKPREGAMATIERLLLKRLTLTSAQPPERITKLEAVILQLLKKTLAGSMRAARVLEKYRRFAHQNMEPKLDLTFVDSIYTRAVARQGKDRTDG